MNFYQISQSKSKVVVFGDEPAHKDQATTAWRLQGMYNDDKNGMPDHIEEVDMYQYLGTWFHQNRKWTATVQPEWPPASWTPTHDAASGALRQLPGS